MARKTSASKTTAKTSDQSQPKAMAKTKAKSKAGAKSADAGSGGKTTATRRKAKTGSDTAKSSPPAATAGDRAPLRPLAWLRRWVLRLFALVALLTVVLLGLYRFVNPPITHTILAEQRRLGEVRRIWVPLEDIAPVMLRSVVAAEDANFCRHWGVDMTAIRDAIADGAARGGSTISQQAVKNVFLWQGRSWVRKAIEAALTPMAEAAWPKDRILEIYLNVAEFDEGVFGVESAARRYFGISASELAPWQAARLAAVLPSPKTRDAANPSDSIASRARSIADGAATINRDGRAACFEQGAL